jgi:titin
LPVLSSGGDTIDAAGAGVIVSGGSRAFDCLVITSAKNTISGLQVRECKIGALLEAGATENTVGGVLEGQGNVFAASETGLRVAAGADGNVVEGNRVGADRPGGTADANEIGVFVGGRENLVGGRNVVSGNERVGITVAGAGNVVSGNYIGTDPSGLVAVPNGIEGIWVAGQGNTVGGSTAAERNIISGNGLFGINVSGSGAAGNVVKGNYIGVDVTGQKGLGNRNGVGVSFGAQNNVIGGVEEGEGNVISGNSVGVVVRDVATTGNAFQGNRIGVQAVGQEPLPNGTGISILGGAQNNTIGGMAKGEGNVISANAIGVLVDGASTSGHTVRGNSIFSNSGAGIEVRDGGNGGLSPPVISRLDPVEGTACAGCTVDIYSDGEDEGQTYEGSALAGPDGAFEADVDADGPNVTATATDTNGNTSPFSQPFAVPP